MNKDVFVKSAEREFLEPVEAIVKGKIPSWLNGSLYRNGPAKFEVGEDTYNHYFDGLAMVQKFEMKDGKVSFRSQFVRSETYKRNMSANRIVVSEFGTSAFPDPCKTFFQRYFAYFTSHQKTDNTSVNVFPMGDELYCATEVPLLNRIDQTTLDVKQHLDLTKYLAVFTATAHPHIDNDGTVHNIGMGKGDRGPQYVLIQFQPQDRTEGVPAISTAKKVAAVPSRWPFSPGYMHSFGMSENHYIVIESGLVINVLKMNALKLMHVPFTNALKWHDGYPTLMHVVSKATGEVQTFEADPFFSFHQLNAYEEDDHLVLDLSCYRTGNIIHEVEIKEFSRAKQISDNDPPMIRRYILPLKADPKAGDGNLVTLANEKASAHFVTKDKVTRIHCTPEQLCDISLEFPALNYRNFNTKKYRFFYGMSFNEEENVGTEKLVKCDLETRQTQIWQEENCFPSEPVFVARPGAKDEDDGVILSAVITFTDEGQRYQYLLVLDAKTWTEIGRAELPQVSIPKTFHGNFLPDWF